MGHQADEIIPTLAVFGLASLRLMPCAQGISSSLLQLQFNREAVSILHSDWVSVNQSEGKCTTELSVQNESAPFRVLSLDAVSYSYPNAKSMALDSVTLAIKEGESVGIMGSSGSGKTTLVDLLLGLLVPQIGRVLYNDQPLIDRLGDWRSKVAYLPQEVFLVDDTLRRNAVLGVPDSKSAMKGWQSPCAKHNWRISFPACPRVPRQCLEREEPGFQEGSNELPLLVPFITDVVFW